MAKMPSLVDPTEGIKAADVLADQLRYFIARCEGTHPDGRIQSNKTYLRFKSALEEYEKWRLKFLEEIIYESEGG